MTYGATSVRPAWQQFIKNLPLPVAFQHRDEFVRDYPLPAAFAVAESGDLVPFIGAGQMDAADLNGLMALVRQRLA